MEEKRPGGQWIPLSPYHLGLSRMQHIHVHTPSGDQCQSPLRYFKPFRSFQCPHINEKKINAGKGSQIAPSHLPRQQLASIAALLLPDSEIRVREGGEATRSFCIVGTVIRWLLLLLLILTIIWLAAISPPYGELTTAFVASSFGLSYTGCPKKVHKFKIIQNFAE